jgi:hypothetical protein
MIDDVRLSLEASSTHRTHQRVVSRVQQLLGRREQGGFRTLAFAFSG